MRWNGNVSKVLYTNYQDPYFRFRSEALHWTIPDNFEYVAWRFDWWSTCPVNLRLRFRILLANFYLRPILINRYMLTTFTRNSARNVCASLHQGLSEYNCLYCSGPIWWCIHFFFHILEEKANDSFSPLATRKQEQRIPNTTCLHIQNPKDLKILNIFQLIVLKYLHLALHRAAVLLISTF